MSTVSWNGTKRRGLWAAGLWVLSIGGVLAVGAGCVQGDRTGADTGVADGGGDGEVGGGCELFGRGCPDQQNCYQTADGTSCRAYDPGAAVGDSCTESPDCGDGQRCYEQTCRRLCDPTGDHEDWTCVPDTACLPLEADGERLAWGICEPREDKCTPWPDDDCPDGRNCYRFKFGLRCRSYDDNADAGDACEGSTDCNVGQVCVDVRGETGRTCRDRCGDDHPCESGECQALNGVDHGACFDDGSDGE